MQPLMTPFRSLARFSVSGAMIIALITTLTCLSATAAEFKQQPDIARVHSVIGFHDQVEATPEEKPSNGIASATPQLVRRSVAGAAPVRELDKSLSDGDDPQSNSFPPLPPAELLGGSSIESSSIEANAQVNSATLQPEELKVAPLPPKFPGESKSTTDESSAWTQTRLNEDQEDPPLRDDRGTLAINPLQGLQAPPLQPRMDQGAGGNFGDFPAAQPGSNGAIALAPMINEEQMSQREEPLQRQGFSSARDELRNSLGPSRSADEPPAIPVSQSLLNQKTDPSGLASMNSPNTGLGNARLAPQQRMTQQDSFVQPAAFNQVPGGGTQGFDPSRRNNASRQGMGAGPNSPSGQRSQGIRSQQPQSTNVAPPQQFPGQTQSFQDRGQQGRNQSMGRMANGAPLTAAQQAAATKKQYREKLKAALRPAAQLLKRFDIDSHSTIPGTPVSLFEMLREPITMQRREQMVRQYWETYYDWAALNIAREHLTWAQSLPLNVSAVEKSLVETAKQLARGRMLAAEVQMGKSQSRLLDFFANARSDDFLPLPSDMPTVSPYDTHYEDFKKIRTVPSSLRGIDQMLEGTNRLIAQRAATVNLARRSRSELQTAMKTGQAPAASVIQAAELCRAAELDLVASVANYNQAIGHYVVTIEPNKPSEQMVTHMIGSRWKQRFEAMQGQPNRTPGSPTQINDPMQGFLNQGATSIADNTVLGGEFLGAAPERTARLEDLPARSLPTQQGFGSQGDGRPMNGQRQVNPNGQRQANPVGRPGQSSGAGFAPPPQSGNSFGS